MPGDFDGDGDQDILVVSFLPRSLEPETAAAMFDKAGIPAGPPRRRRDDVDNFAPACQYAVTLMG